jgi:hypothetical protein
MRKDILHDDPAGDEHFHRDAYWKRQLPDGVLEKLASNGKECTDTDGLPLEDADPVPVVKLFIADGRGTWLLGHTYPNDPDLAFALVDLGYGAELGDVSISELKTLRGALGLPLERDRCFEGKLPISTYICKDGSIAA